MKISIDGFCFSQFSETGVITFLAGLLGAMARHPTEECYVLMTKSNQAISSLCLPDVPQLRKLTCPEMKLALWWKAIGVSLRAKEVRCDLLFIPVTRLPFYRPVKTVVVAHDLGFLSLPEYVGDRTLWKTRVMARYAIEHADAVIAVSELVRREALQHFRVSPDKVFAVPHGYNSALFHPAAVPAEQTREVLEKYGIRQPYLVHVGVIHARKNLARLIRAYRLLFEADQHEDHQLVLVGKLGWKYREILELSETSYPHVLRTGPVPEEDLPVMLKAATAFVMASLYEGFGIAALEALACGTPALLARSGALPEVAGDAAVYFDPYSIEEMAEVIHKLLVKPTLREELRVRGPQRAALYSWQRCVAETLGVFRKCLR